MPDIEEEKKSPEGEITLPQAFLERMKEQLGEDYPAFIRAYEAPPVKAVRANRLKSDSEALKEKLPEDTVIGEVPWCADGLYVDENFSPWRDLSYHQGCYYPQDASAMLPAEVLEAVPGEKILDLCAAPGGKSGQIAGALQGEGLLVSNEIVPKRAKILASNMERLGVSNAIVTSSDSEGLAKVFPEYFDRILVDAPCSGEGMFRKDETAIREWTPEAPELCAARQRDILSHAVTMLRSGGTLVYSTCTFSEAENEGIVRWLIESGQFEEEPFSREGLPEGAAVHLYPHEVRGEGHFVARLRKLGEAPEADESSKSRGKKKRGAKGKNREKSSIYRKASRKEIAAFDAFCQGVNLSRKFGNLWVRDDRLYEFPEGVSADQLETLRVISPGLELGRLVKDRFEPAHALAMSLGMDEMNHVALSDEALLEYLCGQEIPAPDGTPDGFVLVGNDQGPAGFGKKSGRRIANRYPKGLRIQGNF